MEGQRGALFLPVLDGKLLCRQVDIVMRVVVNIYYDRNQEVHDDVATNEQRAATSGGRAGGTLWRVGREGWDSNPVSQNHTNSCRRQERLVVKIVGTRFRFLGMWPRGFKFHPCHVRKKTVAAVGLIARAVCNASLHSPVKTTKVVSAAGMK